MKNRLFILLFLATILLFNNKIVARNASLSIGYKIIKPTIVDSVYLNVKDYGALGDGKSSDSKPIQNALNAGIKKVVYFPAGLYCVTTTLIVPGNITIIFDKGAKIISYSDNNIFYHASGTNNSNITIDGAVIQGYNTGNNQYGIKIDSCNNLKIKNCIITNCARGVRFTNCINSVIKENTVKYCGFTTSSTDRIGMLLEGCNNSIISNNNCSNNIGNGIQLLGGSDMKISNNTCWYNSIIGIIGAGSVYYRLNVIGNSCCFNGTLPITSGAQGGINFHGLTNGLISKNICSNNYNYGIGLNGDNSVDQTKNRSTGTLISNNIVTNNSNIGIIVFQCKQITVSNNTCRSNFGNITLSGADESDIDILNNSCIDDNRGLGNILVNNGDKINIDGNILGEVSSIRKDINELRIESAATNITIGNNDFSRTLKNGCVIIANMGNVSFKNLQLFQSNEIVLSGSEVKFSIPLILPSKYSFISRAYIIYTEATSSDAGIVCGIGGSTNTYWGTLTTSVSATKGTIQYFTINRNGQIKPTDNQPFLYCAGGKTGAGKIKMIIEYVKSIPIYY